MTQMDQYRKVPEAPEPAGARSIQCLLYHKRQDSEDEFSSEWFSDRAAKLKSLSASDGRPRKYILWRDVTPKTTNYFHDTQFSGGSWLQYKALETFLFEKEDDAVSFMEQYNNDVLGAGIGMTQTIIGAPDIIL
jgi:hypothetical protein